VGRTNSPNPTPSRFPELKTWRSVTHEDYNAMLDEMRRLYEIESAALALVGSCHRRAEGVLSPSLATFDRLQDLQATLQQTEET
jgi:hypothetical protein